MNDDVFFNTLANEYGFELFEIDRLKAGWENLSPVVREIMKNMYGSKYRSLITDWTEVDNIIKRHTFNEKLQTI